jgi:Domain of unknown function (DUF3883)
MTLLHEVRDAFLDEGRLSPNLLADVARLEHYVAETYAARSLIELLQNADDAGASRFEIRLVDNRLICSNDGRPFNQQDLVSLCRSGSSTKSRGTSIGYRGIGFKSVVSLARQVHLISGPLALTFDRDLTAKALGVPAASVPLIRVPHVLDLSEAALREAGIDVTPKNGTLTTFVFDGVDIQRTMIDASGFDPASLLFLRSIENVLIDVGDQRSFACSRKSVESGRRITITSSSHQENWEVVSANGTDVAFSLIGGKRTPLKADMATAHAFLPTLETTGLGVRINADFSTDPSRTRIVLDDVTTGLIEDAAKAIADIWIGSLSNGSHDHGTQDCLAATFDLATVNFQRPSFRSALALAIRKAGGERFARVVLKPSWLNLDDFDKITSLGNHLVPAHSCSDGNRDLVASTLRYLGARTIDDQSIAVIISSAKLTMQGRAEITSYAIRSAEIGNTNAAPILDVPALWEADGRSTTIRVALAEKLRPSNAFSESLRLAGVAQHRLAPQEVSNQPNKETSREHLDPFDTFKCNLVDQIISVTRWRHGENAVGEIFRQMGFEVEDHSRQNLGYDLLVRKDGTTRYVEVKSITRVGEPFTMTSNEEVFARRNPETYFVALYREFGTKLELCLIADPANSLVLDRQCRQWVWECSRYQYKPKTFSTLG